MTFDAGEFFALAERIALQEISESAYRTAISRSYYACHLVGRESATLKGWLSPSYSGADHMGLVRVLQSHGVPVSARLQALLRLREHADYHVEAARQPSCEHCRNWSGSLLLVDEHQWQQARDITIYILPRLRAIAPTR